MSSPLDDTRIATGMHRQFALRRERTGSGAKQIGWKVGFGAPAAMQKLQIQGPLIGFLLDSALVEPGAAVSLSGWRKPVAEPEIAVYVGEDVAAGADPRTVRAAISAIGPAIELADIDGPLDDVEAILAGDIFQRRLVLGPRDEGRSGGELMGLVGRVDRSGQQVQVPDRLEANTGEIVSIVRHVADVAAGLGDALRRGHVVICGSVTPPLFLEPSDSHVTFELAPIGRVSVHFAA